MVSQEASHSKNAKFCCRQGNLGWLPRREAKLDELDMIWGTPWYLPTSIHPCIQMSKHQYLKTCGGSTFGIQSLSFSLSFFLQRLPSRGDQIGSAQLSSDRDHVSHEAGTESRKGLVLVVSHIWRAKWPEEVVEKAPVWSHVWFAARIEDERIEYNRLSKLSITSTRLWRLVKMVSKMCRNQKDDDSNVFSKV